MKGNIDIRVRLDNGDEDVIPGMTAAIKEALEAEGLEAKVRQAKIDGSQLTVRIAVAGGRK